MGVRIGIELNDGTVHQRSSTINLKHPQAWLWTPFSDFGEITPGEEWASAKTSQALACGESGDILPPKSAKSLFVRFGRPSRSVLSAAGRVAGLPHTEGQVLHVEADQLGTAGRHPRTPDQQQGAVARMRSKPSRKWRSISRRSSLSTGPFG
jgi:hypothetical protein